MIVATYADGEEIEFPLQFRVEGRNFRNKDGKRPDKITIPFGLHSSSMEYLKSYLSPGNYGNVIIDDMSPSK